jgi:hypothetical protein
MKKRANCCVSSVSRSRLNRPMKKRLPRKRRRRA